MTLAQIDSLISTDNEMYDRASKPKVEKGTTSDLIDLAQMARR